MIVRSTIGQCILATLMLIGALPGSCQTSPGGYVEVTGSKLWFEECGVPSMTAPGVVLLHDGLVHSITWDGVWKPLCSKYHVIRYDRRGYGRSQPSQAPFIPEDDLLSLLRRVHEQHVILIGNSSGGGLALDFAIAHPEIVRGLLLIGPVVHGMASTSYFMERGNRNSAPLAHKDIDAAARNWSQDPFLIAGDDPQARKFLYESLVNAPQNLTVDGGMEIRPSPPPAMRLSEIRVPMLIVDGESDIGDVFAYSGAIVAAAQLASLEIWKGAGHLIQLQKPVQLVDRFNRFYSLVTRTEASLSEAQLAAYVGKYSCFGHPDPMTLKEQRLVFEIPGEPYYRLFAASEFRFFLRTEETEMEFKKDASGKITEMVVYNDDGSVFHCPRQ
jgi:pimeloyl-ACP methyl ester carboxylesterase